MAANFEEFIQTAPFSLSEGSIYERLRRHPAVEFDPYLAHASLIHDTPSRLILENVHREYLDVGQRHGLTLFALTDTWRANLERIRLSSELDTVATKDQLVRLIRLKGRYCLVFQTLRQPPEMNISGHVGS